MFHPLCVFPCHVATYLVIFVLYLFTFVGIHKLRILLVATSFQEYDLYEQDALNNNGDRDDDEAIVRKFGRSSKFKRLYSFVGSNFNHAWTLSLILNEMLCHSFNNGILL